METATAKLSNYRQAPRKVRLVADLIRGKSAQHAINLLSVLPKRAGEPMMKLVQSAVANATKGGLSAADLYVSTIAVNGGIVFKRSMPRARGRAAQILKRTSHITIGLSKKAPKKEKAPKAGAAK
ncbi:MAG TPA: 50S ribosomal protein L22 [Candidatus Paceibacterota bacterium]|jgi:large subunit ribosomal protein L22|nr:50S ribosomal protein L22 [Candidatus Paceibacterota bacterium]